MQVKPKTYLILMLLVAAIGAISAGITFGFIELVNKLIELIWDNAKLAVGLDSRLFTVLVCLLGGVLVGVLLHVFGDHSAIFSELMQEFGKTGRFDYRHAPGILIIGFVSLISGGSLGPEAALGDASGGLGTWIAEKLHLNDMETRTMSFGGLSGMLAAFITNPFAGALLSLESAQGGLTGAMVYIWTLFPSLLASAVATIIYVSLSGSFFNSLYTFPNYSPQITDLLWAIPFSIIGGLSGVSFTLVLRGLQKLFRPIQNRKILKSMIGGLGMGLIGAFLPLTLFSGETETAELIHQASFIGIGMLVILAMSKLFATCLLLATGWKGGYIFPIMFAGLALGMAGHLIFPQTPVAVTVAATMAGAFVAALRAPLFAALFTMVMIDANTAPVIAVSVLISALLAAIVNSRSNRQEDRSKGETVETA